MKSLLHPLEKHSEKKICSSQLGSNPGSHQQSGYSTKELARKFKMRPFETYTCRENSSLGENPRINKAELVNG